MNDNELNRIADLIWTTLNCSKNLCKSRDDQTELIKGIVINIAAENRKIGKISILNYLKDEIKGLEDNI